MTTQDILVLGRKPTDRQCQWTPMNLSPASRQAFIGGSMYCIDLPMEIDLWVNDEFLDIGEEMNVLLRYENDLGHLQPVKGNVFLAGVDDEGKTVPLTDEQKTCIKQHSQTVYYKPNLIPVCMIDLRNGGL